MIYLVNMKMRTLIENNPHLLLKNGNVKYIDFFFPFLTGGQWKALSYDLYKDEEKSFNENYGCVHYSPTIQRELMDYIIR